VGIASAGQLRLWPASVKKGPMPRACHSSARSRPVSSLSSWRAIAKAIAIPSGMGRRRRSANGSRVSGLGWKPGWPGQSASLETESERDTSRLLGLCNVPVSSAAELAPESPLGSVVDLPLDPQPAPGAGGGGPAIRPASPWRGGLCAAFGLRRWVAYLVGRKEACSGALMRRGGDRGAWLGRDAARTSVLPLASFTRWWTPCAASSVLASGGPIGWRPGGGRPRPGWCCSVRGMMFVFRPAVLSYVPCERVGGSVHPTVRCRV